MPKLIDGKTWQRYFEYRQTMSLKDAALKAGINQSSAWRLENVPNYNSSGRPYLEAWRANNPEPLGGKRRLNTQAKRALDDFEYFRLRYFGRRSTPWQVYAADVLCAALEEAKATMERKFIVVNCPPGSGKTTLFTHDIPTWLLCRDRATRVLLGSGSESTAKTYSGRIMTTFERTSIPDVEEHQARRGTVKADACLIDDFGKFKPDNGRNWRETAFKIVQENGQMGTTQESSVSAYGRDSNYMGQRPDISIWDDLVTEETSATPEARERTLRKWESTAEMRVEPGGVLVLQGQRLFADDLYRTCIDAPEGEDNEDDEDNEDEAARKYEHIVFKAHYEENCRGDHGKDAKPYNPADPDGSGCLLDPVGISWKFLRGIQRKDERRGTSVYRITMQQEDGDPTTSLVNPLWVEGGEDPKTGERFIGCWDKERIAGIVPRLGPGCISVLSIDSSPSKFWSIGWWLIHPETKRRFLIDMHRSKMKTYNVLSLDPDTGMYSGLLEDWWQSSNDQGYPITRLIFEANDSEVFFLDGIEITRWKMTRGVLVTRHKTNTNKADPQYGVQSIGPVYMHGQVRLPGDVRSGSRAKMGQLVHEVTNYPNVGTSDCLMMQWFLEFNMPNIARNNNPLPNQPRPGVVKTLPRRPGLTLARRTA